MRGADYDKVISFPLSVERLEERRNKRSLGVQQPENSSLKLRTKMNNDGILKTRKEEYALDDGASCQTSDYLLSSFDGFDDQLDIRNRPSYGILNKTVNFAKHQQELPYREGYSRLSTLDGTNAITGTGNISSSLLEVTPTYGYTPTFLASTSAEKFGTYHRPLHHVLTPSRSYNHHKIHGGIPEEPGEYVGTMLPRKYLTAGSSSEHIRPARKRSCEGVKYAAKGKEIDRPMPTSACIPKGNDAAWQDDESTSDLRARQPHKHSKHHKTNKEDNDPGGLVPGPKYQRGVLVEGWQYRIAEERANQKQEEKPPFKGCSIYKTSYKSPPSTSYEKDYTMWQIREKSEGPRPELIGADKACFQNFTTTTDLVYRVLPQICPKMREYNTNALEWFPPQNFLPCFGNLTDFGLRAEKRAQWEQDRVQSSGKQIGMGNTEKESEKGPCKQNQTENAQMKGPIPTITSTYLDHYRPPSKEYLVKNRIYIPYREFSPTYPEREIEPKPVKCSSLLMPDPYAGLPKQKIPIPECRWPLTIVPDLPEEPPYRIRPNPQPAAVRMQS